jgi:hypothetical protein
LAHLAATAFAIEAFRQAKGRLPTRLEELTPEFTKTVPIDPFDSSPLRYRQLSRGYILYSVDADGRDNGGVEAPLATKATDTNKYDLSFIVQR